MKKRHIHLLAISLAILASIIFIKPILTGNAVLENAANLEIEIPKGYQSINSGDTALFTTKILNLANQGRIDITLRYSLLDENKSIVTERSETLAIETQASFIGKLDVPEGTLPGNYILKVTMIKENEEAISGTHSLKINSEEENIIPQNNNIIFIIIGILALVVLILLLKTPIKNISKKMSIKSKIKRAIRIKIKGHKISYEDLKNSKLPKDKVEEEQIF